MPKASCRAIQATPREFKNPGQLTISDPPSAKPPPRPGQKRHGIGHMFHDV